MIAGSRVVADGRSHTRTAHADTASRLIEVAATTAATRQVDDTEPGEPQRGQGSTAERSERHRGALDDGEHRRCGIAESSPPSEQRNRCHQDPDEHHVHRSVTDTVGTQAPHRAELRERGCGVEYDHLHRLAGRESEDRIALVLHHRRPHVVLDVQQRVFLGVDVDDRVELDDQLTRRLVEVLHDVEREQQVGVRTQIQHADRSVLDGPFVTVDALERQV